jgi:hypothetical protein
VCVCVCVCVWREFTTLHIVWYLVQVRFDTQTYRDNRGQQGTSAYRRRLTIRRRLVPSCHAAALLFRSAVQIPWHSSGEHVTSMRLYADTHGQSRSVDACKLVALVLARVGAGAFKACLA